MNSGISPATAKKVASVAAPGIGSFLTSALNSNTPSPGSASASNHSYTADFSPPPQPSNMRQYVNGAGLVFVALLVHFVDWFILRFDLSGELIYLRVLLYLVPLFLFGVTLLKGDQSQKLLYTILASIVSTIVIVTFAGITTNLFSWFDRFGTALFVFAIIVGILVALRMLSMVSSKIDTGLVLTFLASVFILPVLGNIVIPTFGIEGLVMLKNFLYTYITPIMLPFFFHYAMFSGKIQVHPIWKFVFFVFLIVPLIPVFMHNVDVMQTAGLSLGLNAEQENSVFATFRESWSGIKLGAEQLKVTTINQTMSFIKTGKNSAETGIKKELGFELDAQVERGAVSQLGITIDPIKAGQTQVYQDREALFTSIIKGNSLDSTVNVYAYCNAKISGSENSGLENGSLTKSEFEIRGTGALNQDLVCKFNSRSFKPSTTYDVTIGAKYDFVTSAYVRRYFVKNGLVTNIGASQTFDNAFYEYFKISDRSQTSLYTKGPVQLALGITNPVIELQSSSQPPIEFTFYVEIKNAQNYKGKIDTVRRVLLSIPPGFSIPGTIPELQCSTGNFVGYWEYVTPESCETSTDEFLQNIDCSDYRNFIFSVNESSQKVLASLKAPQQDVTFTCQVQAISPQEILAASPYAVKSFRSRVDYKYDVNQFNSFTVKAPLDGEDPSYNDPTLLRENSCINIGEYPVIPEYSKLFSKNPDVKASYASAYETLRTTLTVEQFAYISGTADCATSTLAKALIFYDWNQVQNNPMVKGSSYGYLRATKTQLLTQIASGKITGITADQVNAMSLDEFDTYMRANYFDISVKYLDSFKESCSNNAACIIGKFKCGSTFTYGDYNSCTSTDLCRVCHTTIIPNVYTLARQIESGGTLG